MIRRRRIVRETQEPLLLSPNTARAKVPIIRPIIAIIVVIVIASISIILPITLSSNAEIQHLNVSFTLMERNGLEFIYTDNMVTLVFLFRDTTACVQPATFTLNPTSEYFLRSDNTTFIPDEFTPASAAYETIKISTDFYIHLFRDSTIRITGAAGAEFPNESKTFRIPQTTCIQYLMNPTAIPEPQNFLVSSCISDTSVTTNNNLFTSNGYYEYFGLEHYNGIVHIAAVENCHSNTNTTLVAYYTLNHAGVILNGPVVLNSTVDPRSLSVFRYTSKNEWSSGQNEPEICLSKTSQNISIFYYTLLNDRAYGLVDAPYSTDNGVSWTSTQPLLDMGIPARSLAPLFPNIYANVNCSGPLSLADYSYCYGSAPESISDNRCAVDDNDVYWITGMFSVNGGSARLYCGYSTDRGRTYTNVFTKFADFGSYDFPTIATGKNVTYISVIERLGGSIVLQLIKIKDRVSGITMVDANDDPESIVRGFGDIAVDRDNNDALLLSVSTFPFGSESTFQAQILFIRCKEANLKCSVPKTIAVSDWARVPNPAQLSRKTHNSMRITTDKNNVIYVSYMGNVRQGPQFTNFANELLLIHSTDGGNTWSTPKRINNDEDANANTHFNFNMAYDPITHALAFAWIDTRIDPENKVKTQHYMAVVPAAIY